MSASELRGQQRQSAPHETPEDLLKRLDTLKRQAEEDTKRIQALEESLKTTQDKSLDGPMEPMGVELDLATYPRYDLSGFMDFNYAHFVNIDEDHRGYGVFSENSAFFVGNLNLYNDIKISPNWRVFFEIRFLFQPNGDERTLAFMGQSYQRWDTTSFDYLHTLFIREQLQGAPQLRWGGIEIERAWVDWNYIDLFNVRVGLFLSPYGIWNIDHASPIQLGIIPPFTVLTESIPERQSGIQVYGRFFVANHELGYHLTLSNGRSPIDTLGDFDDNKAIGGRVYYSLIEEISLTAGLSWYLGEYTDIEKAVDLETNQITITPTRKYDEVSLATDISLKAYGLTANFEFDYRRRFFKANTRPLVTDFATGLPLGEDILEPDHYQIIYSITLAYTLPCIPLTPMLRFDRMRLNDKIYGWSETYTAGLNYRIIQAVVVKLNFIRLDFFGWPSIDTLAGQIAVAF